MVTRVYNSYMPNIVRPQKEAEQKLTPDAGNQGFDTRQQSQGLATVVEEAQHHKIHLNTILHDFKSTMDALGADDTIRGEVDAYLNVVSLQAEKTSPSVPFIRQTLKTAADSLDGFIAKALDQPSRVVRDWVEALLLQKIEYRDSTSPVPTQLNRPSWQGGDSDAIPEKEADSLLSPLSLEEKKTFKAQVQQGKTLVSQGDILEGAMPVFQSALEYIQGKDQPLLEGQLLTLMGRTLTKANQKDQAITYFKQAERLLGQANQWERQATLRYKLGTYYDERGELEVAQHYYEGALSLRKANQSHQEGFEGILNDLGVLYLRQGDSQKALVTLSEATHMASVQQTTQVSPFLPDIHSNLGALHRLNQDYAASATAYRQSLKMAQALKDKASYTRSLNNLMELYRESGQTEKIPSLQQRLNKLQSQ